MDDRALVYRGADQPDMSVINPESDVWQHIKVVLPCLPRGCHVLNIWTDSAEILVFELACSILIVKQRR